MNLTEENRYLNLEADDALRHRMVTLTVDVVVNGHQWTDEQVAREIDKALYNAPLPLNDEGIEVRVAK